MADTQPNQANSEGASTHKELAVKEKRPVGRPTIYCEELVSELCRRVGSGETLRAVCATEKMPSRDTVMRWMREKPGFSDQYRRAREDQVESWADQIVEIADNPADVDNRQTKRDALRVGTRQWLMSKLKPREYGDTKHLLVDSQHQEVRRVVIEDTRYIPPAIRAQMEEAGE